MEIWLDWLNLTSCTVHTTLRLEITYQRGVMCQKAVISIYMTSLQITSNVSVQNSTLLTSSRRGQYPWRFVKYIVPLISVAVSDNYISFLWAGSVVGIAIGYGLDGPGIESR